VVLAVFETSGSDDSVQEEMVKTVVCRTWIFASCISEEARPELVGVAVRFRAPMRMRNKEGSTG
jgi:hypothetical protein